MVAVFFGSLTIGFLEFSMQWNIFKPVVLVLQCFSDTCIFVIEQAYQIGVLVELDRPITHILANLAHSLIIEEYIIIDEK
jgi:hypothetical protein